ncbi:Leucine-rich repeat and fibronectin type III domain-containing protein 1 [Mizuhopecten yessoensis]|uniref:Leucine-rich repeat and fibronectin type III domain-containing protein 1 n=1 Tax=Mizuhopecten yessoensis TaxID=6573 RepID=A0A210PL78_MIZYE|nr:Leucine-rich repeat and fibronectin type III domain-containing protein 1 [Mizuhopecten yessoensis]
MSGNPLQCNCELRWLKHSTKKALDPEYASDALVCYGPERLKYAPILRVPDLEFKCVAPQIVNCTTETYVVMETSSLRMWCELGGDPYPDVTWTRYDGKNVEFTYENTSNYYVSRTGSLDIFNVSQADDAPDHVNPNPTNIPPDDNDKTDDDSDEVKPTNRADEDGGGMNMMMIAGAGGGGLLLIVLIAVIVYCVKRKKGSNRVEDISIRQDNDFDSVRSPRRHRVNDF